MTPAPAAPAAPAAPPAPAAPAGPGWTPDEVLSALADPGRRRLLEELSARGAATATSLAGVLPVSRQAVVKQLTVLSRSGLVSGERLGREVRYAVRTDGITAAARWMAGLAAEWDGRLAEIKRLAEIPPGS